MRSSWARSAILLVALFPSCTMLKPPADLDSMGRRALRAVTAGDSVALRQIADASTPTSAADDDYRAVALTLGAWAPDSIALVGWNANFTGHNGNAQLSYELHGRQGWALALLSFSRRPEGYRLIGFNLTPEATSLAALNWTTGQWAAQPANLLFFGGALTLAGFARLWELTCGLPPGACIALWRRAEYRRQLRAERVAGTPAAAAV